MLKHEEQEKLIDNIVDSFDSDIATLLLNIEKELNNILLTNGINEELALNFEVYFLEALEKAGYYERVNDYIDNNFDELYLSIREGINLGGFDVKYTADDLEKIAALKQLQLDQFTNLTNESAKTVQKNLYKYVLGGASLSDIQSQLLADFQGSNLARHSTTLARTAIADFQQSVIDMKSQGLDGVWVYLGGIQSNTREFCRKVTKANHYYTDSQKMKIQNDPKRRYNCTHRLRYISKQYAIDEGYTSA